MCGFAGMRAPPLRHARETVTLIGTMIRGRGLGETASVGRSKQRAQRYGEQSGACGEVAELVVKGEDELTEVIAGKGPARRSTRSGAVASPDWPESPRR